MPQARACSPRHGPQSGILARPLSHHLFVGQRCGGVRSLPATLSSFRFPGGVMSANDSASEADKWDMSKERELIDTLLGQRFNFFLVFFALMVNGALDARAYHDTQLVNGILTVGATVSLLLALSIGRLQKKLDAIL